MTTKPCIVLVHGGWHVPEHYADFIRQLENSEFEVHCPLLPTCSTPTSTGFEDDVKVVHDLLRSLVNSDQTIILLLHSYGGSVGTEAAKGISSIERSRQALKGGILHLIYMCAFLLLPGESVGSASLPRPDPDPVKAFPDGTTFLCISPRQLFYADVEDELAAHSTKLLVHQSGVAMMGAVTYPAWKSIPTTYLKCTEDQVLFPAWQERQLQNAKDAGVEIETWTYASSHSPWLSMPDKMLEAVEDISARYG